MFITAAAVASLSVLSPSSALFSSSDEDSFLRDEDRRVAFFHGENFVQKGAPWYPEVLLEASHLDQMQTWGFNTVRLGVMWSGVEPQMGVFNETYISVIGSILDQLQQRGIAALLDVHQDVLSSYFCLYDGAPTWAVDLSTSSQQAFPWPLEWDGSNPCPADRQWGANYLAEATGAAFQDLYDNTNGMRDRFASFWTKVASSFKDKDILGYEIINEPWAGDIYRDPARLLPGVAGRENLQPFYDIISTAIRQSDPDHLIFYEPVTWGMIFNGTVTGSGFTQVPGGEQYKNKSVFSFHYYCWWFSTDDKDSFVRQTCDRMFGPKVFAQAKEEARVLGGSMMLTEWGLGCEPDRGIVTECDAIMNLADEYLMSWIDWFWTGQLMNGWQASDEAVAIYSRTFAQRVAGAPTKMKFDAKSGHYELCYLVDVSITTPTEIFANFDLQYPEGVRVALSGSAAKHMQVEVKDKIYVQYVGPTDSQDKMDCCVIVAGKQ